VETIYVIRQTPLTSEVERGRRPLEAGGGVEGGGASGGGSAPAPAGVAGAEGTPSDGGAAAAETADPGALISELATAVEGDAAAAATGAAAEGAAGTNEATPTTAVDPSSLESVLNPGSGEGQYVHVPGRGWEMVAVNGGGAAGMNGSGASAEGGIDPAEMVTQQVIEVDAERLMLGEARYNIVVRPGDVIQIPLEVPGLVYLMGPGINRPGVFNLSSQGRTTVKQIVAAAGGLSAVAIPERVDLVRRVTATDEATVRINLRAIFEGVQPDFYLSSHDTLNFGTNIFASHLAVIRNSFRFSYGMGFLLDRNFGTDVFGPVQNQGQGGF
jgi:hypothetical protein